VRRWIVVLLLALNGCLLLSYAAHLLPLADAVRDLVASLATIGWTCLLLAAFRPPARKESP
jgi:hypothetical protein